MNQPDAMLEVRDLSVRYPIRQGRKKAWLQAVNHVSFDIACGETLGLVGESGCGKSTIARAILRLTPATEGQVRFDGVDLLKLEPSEMRKTRKDIQVVFQDPYASFNPRMRVEDIVAEPLIVHGIGTRRSQRATALELLDRVGLGAHHARRRPSALSGGQRQRVGIARALALRPRLVVADEPVSSLDVSVQAQVLNLMMDLREEFGLAYLFISHDLSVIEHISNRIGVMYLGRMVELSESEELYRNPRHPYTQALLSAIPDPDPQVSTVRNKAKGEIPSPADPPPGCVFHTRCPWVVDECREIRPALSRVRGSHHAACHLKDDPRLVAAGQALFEARDLRTFGTAER